MQKAIAKIDLGAIRHNARYLKGRANGALFYAVVKADAYGHGAVQVARALKGIADGFCVAIVDEAVELRVSGITSPVLVLTPPLGKDDAERMRAYDIAATAADIHSARLCRGLDVHVKINTGMNRFGCPPAMLSALLAELNDSRVCGVYSHIYAPLSQKDTLEQLAAFRHCVGLVKQMYPSAVAHFAATAGTLAGGELLFDGVRCGIGLYGYAPRGFACDNLRHALTVTARRVQTHVPPFGGGAGYMAAERSYARISTYRAGYADGLPRTYPLGIGNLCMDSFVSEGWEESVCVLSDAQKVAEKLGTISYEVLCNATKRCVRVYEG